MTTLDVSVSQVSDTDFSQDEVTVLATEAARIENERLDSLAATFNMPPGSRYRANGPGTPVAWRNLNGELLKADGTVHAKHGPSKSEDLGENQRLIREIQSVLNLEKNETLLKAFKTNATPSDEIVQRYETELARRDRVMVFFGDLANDSQGFVKVRAGDILELRDFVKDGTLDANESVTMLITEVEGKKGRKGGLWARGSIENPVDPEGEPIYLSIGWRDMSITTAPTWVDGTRKGGHRRAINPRGPRVPGDPNAEKRAVLKGMELQSERATLRRKGAKRTDADNERLAVLDTEAEALAALFAPSI